MADLGLTGVLLLGGASRRFGAPKALAERDGETLAARGWRVLGEACDERLAFGKAADRLTLPFPLLDDGTEIRHPAAGIVAALRVARHAVCVVLPVDCPLITADALRALGAACLDAAWSEGPLPGAYRRTALPALERCLAAQDSIRRACAGLEIGRIPLAPGVYADVDTPGELDALR